jgi:hypothetical protein
VGDPYEYAVVRVVPDLVREEFVNVGAVVLCEARGFLRAACAMDEARLRAFSPGADVAVIAAHVEAILRVCRGEGPMGALPVRERFRWIVSPRNAIVQTSCAHGGVTADPEAALAQVLERMVRRSQPAP